MSSDIPLPTPFSVTSSPIHMMRPVPAVKRDDDEDGGHDALIRNDGQVAARKQLTGAGQRHQGGGVQQAEGDGEVPGVLRQL